MVCKQASTVGGEDLQLREDQRLVRPCPSLAPNSTVATLKLALISELCVLTFMRESEKYVTQHGPVQRNACFFTTAHAPHAAPP